jgi:AcrR family transcriptional regulator
VYSIYRESSELTKAVKPKRRYDSKRRLEQAQETRRAILAAAKTRFEERGYAAATVAEIAADAGVATKTVYLAFDSKGGVLRALWNLMLRGEQDDQPVADQEWYREVLEEHDPERQLRLNARNSTQGKQRLSSTLEVIRSAATTDGEIDELWQRIQSDYRENQRAIVAQLAKRKALSPGLNVERAADILWTINHPNTWQLLVVERGWTPEEYERWAAESARAQLLPPGA